MPAYEAAPGQSIAYDIAGSGPPVLLLHGFPQTRAMWRPIAARLAARFTVVTADLRGYGDSFKPAQMSDMSFRAMAGDMVALMRHLGFERFDLVGHDRGGRTAHRLALDTPAAVQSLAVLDIVPTHHLLTHMDHRLARAYYHWLFLAQPHPVPERLIAHDPVAYFHDVLGGLGGALGAFDPGALAAYEAAWRDPETVRSMCDDYRAAIDVDFLHDARDLHAKVNVPALVAYGADGIMARSFDVPGTWAGRLAQMTARALPGGHFFPDTHPVETYEALAEFLTNGG